MLSFERMAEHEQVMFCQDPRSGLKAIIAIHNTTLGPALGGCRMRPYSTVDEALDDALRLSRGMTYKCAACDVDFGGGKAVMIGDPLKDRNPALFRAFGQFVEALGGRFYTGTDMGTTPQDFVEAAKETSYIVGLPEENGGHGDSSIPTAEGVLYSIKATCQMLWGEERLDDKVFSIQGLGKVGYKVAERLLREGARLFVTDVYTPAVKRVVQEAEKWPGRVEVVEGEKIYSVPSDIFVPCALGGILNDKTIDQLRVKAVVGSANNQLQEDGHCEALREKGILYAPDYIVNSGGLIQVSDELYVPNKTRVMQKTKAIYHTLLDIYKRAQSQHVTTVQAANEFCEERLEARRARNSFFTPGRPPKWRFRQ